MIVVMNYPKPLDPYGVVTQSSGLSHTDYGFTGESYSPSTQLTYLRARYYNPADGRFQSRDTWSGGVNRPLSLNRWNYVEGNPINLTDPSGQCYIDGDNLRRWRIFEVPITGPCENDHHPNDLSSIYPHWHEYWTDNVVCPAYFSCSQQEIIDALSRFAYPGQNSAKPVVDGDKYSVFPFNEIYPPWGAIRSESSKDHLTVKNIAQPTHIFYAGEIWRTAKQWTDGSWHVKTHGFGNNIFFEMDTVNLEFGPGIFNTVDLQMRVYITENHFKSWLGNFFC